MTLADRYIIRDLRPGDVRRIFKDWLMSYRREKALRAVPNPVYFHWYHALIESLLVDSSVAWLVVCDPERPDVVVGWLCAQEFANKAFLVHYVYVSRTFRRWGIASRLLASLGVQKRTAVMCSNTTFAGECLLSARECELVYNPFLMMGRCRTEGLFPITEQAPRADVRAEIRRSAKELGRGFNQNEKAEERDV